MLTANPTENVAIILRLCECWKTSHFQEMVQLSQTFCIRGCVIVQHSIHIYIHALYIHIHAHSHTHTHGWVGTVLGGPLVDTHHD